MTRINYVEQGIYSYTKDDCKEIITNLSSAHSVALSLSCPSNFSYKSYISNLDNTINEYYKEIIDIDAKIKFADTKYEEVTDEMTEGVLSLDISVLKDRDRLIV